MARKPAPEPPAEKVWTPDLIRAGMRKLRRRLNDVEAFDPQTVTRQFDPKVTGLETSIREMLADVFGPNTRSYRNYQLAASLDTAGVNSNGTPLYEVVDGLVHGKARAITLLQGAIRFFEEKMEDDFPGEPLDQAALSATTTAALAGTVNLTATPEATTNLTVAYGPDGASLDPNPPFIIRPPFHTPADEYESARARKMEADYENLMARVALLEAAIAPLLNVSFSEPAIGIGHNKGPRDFEPLSDQELVKINQMIALLKAQGPIPPSNPALILDLQAKTSQTATKVKEYVEDVGKAAAKGFGAEIGKRLAQSPFWIALYHQMGQVSEALIVWLTNIPH